MDEYVQAQLILAALTVVVHALRPGGSFVVRRLTVRCSWIALNCAAPIVAICDLWRDSVQSDLCQEPMQGSVTDSALHNHESRTAGEDLPGKGCQSSLQSAEVVLSQSHLREAQELPQQLDRGARSP